MVRNSVARFRILPSVKCHARASYRNVLGAIDDAGPVNCQINLLYYFFPLLTHFIVCDLSVAQCVLRLCFDRLSQCGDSRSPEVLRHCCMLYGSFFNRWKFSLPPLERHQWNNTYKSLPQDYMFCQMEYVCRNGTLRHKVSATWRTHASPSCTK